MIKAIIFDIGGVITHTDWDKLYANFANRFEINPQAITDFHRENIDSILLGDISFDELLEALNIKDIEAGRKVWLEEAMKLVSLDSSIMGIVDALKNRYRLIVLTNISESRIPVDEKLNLYSHFHEVLLSCRERLIKPNPEFYKLALMKINSSPEEAIFIDDTEGHVKAAGELGINGIIFKTPEKLKEDLKSLGVRVD